MIVDDLPTGAVLTFCLNVFISFFFQFVGFLLTYLLHTSHAAKFGSRAGLGLTLIQYGFYSRTVNIVVPDPQLLSSSSERSEMDWGSDSSSTALVSATSNQLSSTSKDWLSFLLMTLGNNNKNIFSYILIFVDCLGWFLLLSSILGFWRVKRWERSVRTPAVSPTVEQVDNHLEESTNPVTPTQNPLLQQARLARDLRAAGFV